MSSYKDLQARCAKLLDTMANDPERPAWQLELVRITLEGLSTAAILQQENKRTKRSYAELLNKVESLERRYSDLLYQLSSMKND